MFGIRLSSPRIFGSPTRCAACIAAMVAVVCVTHSALPLNCIAQSNCPEPAAFGLQPYPVELVGLFEQAGTNRLGGSGPVLLDVWNGYPPSQAIRVSPYAPCILLKAIGYTESTGWKQFAASYGQYGNTVIAPSGDPDNPCGYGIMQITTGMNGGSGFDPTRVASESNYNIGTGARLLMGKWNGLEFYVGNNNPYITEDWYYAVWAYNGFLWKNNPNNPRYPWPRSTWQCGQNGGQVRANWPYQELVWGCAANPPGSQYWNPVSLTLPNRTDLNSDPPPVHINRPEPSHGSCSILYLPLASRNRPPCAQPVVNGGFESGSNSWALGGTVLISNHIPHDGVLSAWLGGYANGHDTMYQGVAIPNTNSTGQSISVAVLRYYWYMTTTETTHPYDHLWVRIRNTAGIDLVVLDVRTDADIQDTWTLAEFDVSAFVGQSIQVYFEVTTNSKNATSFFIDDVSLFACPG